MTCVMHVIDFAFFYFQIAVNLRKKRFDSGALRLDQVKLQFALDHESGMPSGYSVYQQRDSNR